MPEALRDVPTLEPGLDAVWELYDELSSERSLGFGMVGPIPRSAVLSWAQDVGLDGISFDYVWHLIQAMDEVYLEHAAKQKPGKT